MDNSTLLAPEIAPNENGAPAMATHLTPANGVTNGHTSPLGDRYGDGAAPADLNASVEGKSDGKGGWTPGFRAKTAPERALKWERHFTEPGQDPFDSIEWEMRTAGITGEDGKSVFEQTNCEIPKPWSQLATNVVVSKYFRGPINSPTREHSVKQVIGRVADTIGLWGAQGGYFASDEDAENFRDELAYLLVHQYGAFNSPVWFNLGVKDAKQQCSACQPYDALVSTPAGLIPIGELVEKDAVGHAVYDANGVARIVAVKHNGRKNVLRLHLKSGYTLDVTADHQVWKRTGFSKGHSTGKWVEAGALKVHDMLMWHRTPVTDKSQELSSDVAEAALAGWLQSDGFVGRYDHGTNRSLTIEAMTVNAAEEQWVRAALDAVFPGAHSHTRSVETQDENLDCQRIRIYGDFMEPFIQKWGLMTRGNAMSVPPMLYTAPLPVVVAYLRSLFQAEGYVSVRDNARISFDMVSEGIVRGVQSLLGRVGIYARVSFKADARADRQGCWSLNINSRGDRELFAQEIGFIATEKQDKVQQSLLLEGHTVKDSKTMQIERIEVRGEMDVYDIQTTSGEYLSNGIRVHNCFINDVYDDMESIMELAATEARLFKGGSGAGVNLWRIRSSKEQLRGGGIASGPISFMRGWDAFAGAVKSGGTTRRAAKMVILNADHPDIAEFITCKADEEKKAWALIEAGYNGGFNVPGGAYDSVDFQNANHSVRVTDEFMRAAENDTNWQLRAVTDGKVLETKRARQMLQDIAQTTWICGDPGMQFDTIINDWHTCSNSDRIYASNPCSEFMFLNSTACNLASLNLLKFYNMETGEFDAAGYSRACEVFITAQEIIVSFASYPTQKIGEMSEQYRPLGLGYANLGALLMAKGLAYDSDEGRALAGALTAIMTGAAYRKSAQIARNTGPFEGYVQNKEPMLRVIAKHRDAVNRIDTTLVAQNVMQEARNVWDDAYMTGQKYGYRNSQATVLAPTGCLVAGSLVSTDKGLVRLERLGNPDGAQWQDADFRVYTDGGVQNATKFFINGLDETRVITTQAGYTIQGTGKHRVKVVNTQTGVWEWKHFRDLMAGDLLPLAMNTIIGEAQTVVLPPLGQLHWNGEWNTRVPAHMTADLAEMVGYFMGDGSLHAKGLRFCVADGDDDVAARLSELGRELFGLEAHLTQQKGYIELMLSSVSLAHWWDAAGFTKAAPNAQHRGKGYVPRVPDAVLHSNDAHIYGAFLRGLFEADGTNTLGVPSVSTAHKTFADEIRSLLLALGFPTSSKVDTSQWGNADLHVQRLRNGSYNPQWLSKIGFMGARKTAGVIELKGALSGKGDRVFLPRELWDELIPCGHPLRGAMQIALKRHGGVARQLAAQIYSQTGDERVAHVLNYFFNEVQSNEDGGEQMTYDLSVPANVTYVANGFVSHNTISFMMDCDTTGVEPDIALVKYKKLVGGGLLKIVNQTVPAALRNLGYDESEIKTIVDYIDKNDTIEGAPGLDDEHLSVFDCAFKAMNGTRSIHHMGHIKMMAATQPFISGAISKTVNMPQDCTADEIYDAYLQSWKMGVKAVAIYRDGSKRTQPLSTASDAQKADKASKADKKEAEVRRAARRKLPDERNSITHKFSIAGQEGYFMVGLYEDGSPGEIFIKMSKEGSTISGLMDSFAVAVSMCLQYGVPLRVLVNKFSHTRFEPSGYTTNRDIPIAKSLMDYIFRWFDLKFHPNGDNGHIGKLAAETAALPVAANGSLFEAENSGNNGNVGNAQREVSQMQQDAPPCPDCGALTVRSGSCYKCNECGATTGCG